MNQIIYISKANLKNNNVQKTKKDIKKYSFIFILSISFLVIFFTVFINFKLEKNDNYSSKLVNNYNISQLYNNDSKILINSSNDFSVIGMIDIPSLKITYPILSDCNDSNLKISPCKVSGPSIGKIGNFCIAGHNYNNSLFFSKIMSLQIGDEILLFDLDGNCYSYFISSKFEVDEKDLSVLDNSDKYELTLITCNNLNSNRYIVKALADFSMNSNG
jgi:LPXTG-site transpeptidase (sortase) family protein